jgi:hypothetical protein
MRRIIIRKNPLRARAMFLAAVGAIALPIGHRATALAADSWIATNGGNWSDGSKWSTGSQPVATDVYITNSFTGAQTITYNYTNSAVTLSSFTLGSTSSGGTDTFLMAANNLTVGSSSDEDIGNFAASGGIVNFIQSGGTNTANAFNVAPGNSSTAFYTLSGTGALNITNNYEAIGSSGFGEFSQSAGTNTLSGAAYLQIGSTSGATGTYVLSGGVLSSGNEFVGDLGAGNFNQTGGINSISAGNVLYIGDSTSVTANYLLATGAILIAPSEEIGNHGLGNFNQTGGTNSVVDTGGLKIGSMIGSSGSYTLSGGALASTVEYIGDVGTGTFNQSGGTNTLNGTTSLYLGYSAGALGTYTLSGGALGAPNATEYIGFAGGGGFNQSGGTNTANGAYGLVIGGMQNSGFGSYTISAGSLTAAGIDIGFFGHGGCLQSGGNVSTSNSSLNVGQGGTGSYNLTAGNLTTSGEAIGLTYTTTAYGNFNQSGGLNSIPVGGLTIGINGSTGRYTLTGGTLSVGSLGETVGALGTGIFNQSGGTNTMSGNSELQLGSGAGSTGTYTFSGGALSAAGGTYVGGVSNSAGGIGTLNISGTGVFTSSNLTIWNRGLVNITGGSTTITSLQITAGLLNLNTSSFTISYGSNASPNTAIRNYISSAYNVGGTLWTGTTGITSSNAAASPAHRSVAFANGSDGVVTNLPAGVSSAIPGGGVLPAGTELVTTAFPGDANLDGKVDFNDFVAISTHFLANDINWDHGNFNYDGAVDFNDFVILSTNFGDGVTGGDGTGATVAELAQFNAMATSYGISSAQIKSWDATISNLPEPASASLIALTFCSLMLRRRKTRKSAATLGIEATCD